MEKLPAMLLVGPSASGKSPLGDLIQERGLGGSTFVHFDFGKCLRAAAWKDGLGLNESEIDKIRSVLEQRRLLLDSEFGIAEKIFRCFLSEKPMAEKVVMNGLPRHLGQVESCCALVDIATVVYLSCSFSVLHQRIQSNIGGDREGRNDDTLNDISIKIASFEKLTLPMIDFFQSNAQINVLKIEIGTKDTPDSVYQKVADQLASA